jgi:hypothetical protein
MHFDDILQNIAGSVCVDRLVADAGYDSEAAHRIAAEGFDITTIIPPKIGRRAIGLLKTPYRRAMKTTLIQLLTAKDGRWRSYFR